jgi:glutaryl-CoA dehydrogenase (non-decarboxylating)
MELTPRQKSDRAAFRAFVEREIAPHADEFDRRGFVPDELIGKVAREGYLGLTIPAAYGGSGRDMVTLGLLHEEVGRGCSSVRSLLTVHGMVAQAVLRWGGQEMRSRWLPLLARGERIAAYGLSEQNAGSDARAIETRAESDGECYVLNGLKKWISFGQVADLFLVFARCQGRPMALLVERCAPGLETEPISGMLGTRASMLAEVRMSDCRVPRENLVGREGVGLTHVLPSTLDFGRYSVAWGCVGIAQACLEACVRYASERKQFGSRLLDHQLIRRMVTEMIVNTRAARLLCYQAGRSKEAGEPGTLVETLIAKYFASTAATRIARDAVQLHGASGCSGEYPVQRYLRDATVMEIIEGSTQLLQSTIAECEAPNVFRAEEAPAA